MQQISFLYTFFIAGSEMASQEQWFYGCFIHRIPQSPDITWKNTLSFSLGITAIWPDPNLDLLCARQSDTAPFCENYAKLYFDAKYLKKGLNRDWVDFWYHFFFKKIPFLANIRRLLPLNVKHSFIPLWFKSVVKGWNNRK